MKNIQPVKYTVPLIPDDSVPEQVEKTQVHLEKQPLNSQLYFTTNVLVNIYA